MFQAERYSAGNEVKQSRNDYIQNVVSDLLEEKKRLGEAFPAMKLLLDDALDNIYSSGKVPGKEFYADVFNQKPLKVTQKVYIPLKEHPFNFTGKLLGPKGNTLRRLQEETQCRIVLKGRNSMRDKNKEEELRESGDPKYAHFNKDLYVEISAIAPPPEAHARVAYALNEIRKYINPDKNDEVSQEQYEELLQINPELAKAKVASKPYDKKRIYNPNSSSIYEKTILGSHSQEAMEYEQDAEPEGEPVYSTRVSINHNSEGRLKTAHKRIQPTTRFGSDLKRGLNTQSSYKTNYGN